MASKYNYLGVDLAGSSLKVVELKNVSGRPQLVTYGFIDETYSIIKDDNPAARQALAQHLKELLKTSRATSDRAISALPSFSVFSSIISLPAMNKKDLISAVRWEAKKFVPIPLEEMILDWEVLKEESGVPGTAVKASDTKQEDGKETAKRGGTLKVLMTAAPKNLVNRYVEVFKLADLQLVGLETESFALERALIGNDKNPIMVIDIGNESTSIIIFSGGVPILNRSIDVGGKTITKSLIETMGISDAQAEQFKRDMFLSLSNEPLTKLPRPFAYVINSIINEIRYIINIYQSQHKQSVSKIILCGGSSFLGNVTGYLENIFRIKAYVGDPWARIIHPVEIDTMLKQLGPRMSVAIGLAMREIV